MTKFNIVVLASCGGGNFEYLVQHKQENNFNILKLICDRNCGAIQKAKKYNIPFEVIDKKKYIKNFSEMLSKAIPLNIDLIVLAGFLPILDEEFCDKWRYRIINTHPSLLPKYGGKGMYGVKVQEAVMRNHEKFAGCTVHYVNKDIDCGDIISQTKIEVDYSKTPWEIGGKVFKEEGPQLVRVINKLRNEKPLVTIGCLAYNHAKYIKQCLDGFVNQQTNFKFEVLIHDDCSTDGTTEIIKEYEDKYPNIIKPVYEKENQFSKNKLILKTFILPRTRGKYLAICEGDDYWTDPYKLQKQVDFMEANEDYTICFHPVKRIFEEGIHQDDIYPAPNILKRIEKFDFKSLLFANFIQTNSVMYRWNALDDVASKLPDNILPGDHYLHLLFAKVGKIKMLEDVMSVYRINAGGIWHQAYINHDKLLLKYALRMMNYADNIYRNITNYDFLYLRRWNNMYSNIEKAILKNKDYKLLFQFWNKFLLKKIFNFTIRTFRILLALA